jgi:hypothetical protein
MRAIIRLVFLTALRDRLFSGLFGLVFLVFGISLFLGNAAVLEQREMGMVYAAGTLRFVFVLGLAVFISFLTQRLYESREIEGILSRALPRSIFVFAYWVGFSLSAAILIVPVALILFYLYGFHIHTILWCISLLLECLVVLAFALFAALTIERATTTIFVTLAFYGFTRLIGFFLGIREATPDLGVNRYVNPMLDALGLIIPRLDLMTQSNWLVYGFDDSRFIPLVLTQAAVFIALALCAAAFDLGRKEF